MTTYEAFVYLWYDSDNKMYYLGYHKGSIDDNYAHSSTKMESFTMKSVPSGYRRRILATGSTHDMIALEEKLLRNIKERGKWPIYYNANISGVPYMWDDPEFRKMMSERRKELWSDPERRKMQSEKMKEHNKKLWSDPERRKMKSEKIKKLWSDPEFRKMKSEKMKEQNKKQWTDPEFQKMQSERNKKLWSDPEYRKMHSEKMKEQNKKLWADPEFRKMQSEKRKGMKYKKSKNKQVSSLKDFFS